MTAYEITTCQVINKHDDLLITICTEWLNSDLEIMIFMPDSLPLSGQMKSKDIDLFAKNLSKTREEYLETTRRILSGKDTSVEFVLKDFKFRWKKGAWNHGMLEVFESKYEDLVPSLLKKIMTRDEGLEKTVDKMKKENEDLKAEQNLLNGRIEEIIRLKNEFEEDIYKRFVTILNSKKEKIRELQNELNKKQDTSSGRGGIINNEDQTYNMKTDSEDEDIEMTSKKNYPKKDLKIQRRPQDKTRMSGELFTNSRYKNLGDEVEEATGQTQLLLAQPSSDSDGKMIDSDFESNGRSKRNNKNVKHDRTKLTTEKELNRNLCNELAVASTSKYDDAVDQRPNKNNKMKKQFSTVSIDISNSNKSMLNFENEESDEDMFD